ncbi:MAG: ligand-binding protein SH3 [Candidatus Saccharicenans sp.]|nr:ligand-binding protein SH3 [Candidatus Saccharicenans sp.]
METYRAVVIKNHRPEFSEFFESVAGDEVEVGREYIGNRGWRNWLWVRHLRTGSSGWVPRQLLTFRSDKEAVFNSAYSSKELGAGEKEEVEVLEELNGWAWCRNQDKEKGWIPLENLKRP